MPTTEKPDLLREVVALADTAWQAGHADGVVRQPLSQCNEAAAFERFAPGARYNASPHPHATEILVLGGSFADDSGRYPVGTYIRNPPGFRNTLFSQEGGLLFVRACHFADDDVARHVVDTAASSWRQGLVAGLRVLPLHTKGTQNVALVDWQPGTYFQPHTHFGGEEILVMAGEFADEYGVYPAGTWIRSPHLSRHTPFSKKGCRIWVKTGHLPVDGTERRT
jgi:anti-sigma factor ChrR (cupin superfamily)